MLKIIFLIYLNYKLILNIILYLKSKNVSLKGYDLNYISELLCKQLRVIQKRLLYSRTVCIGWIKSWIALCCYDY